MAFKAVNNFGMDAELAAKMNAKYDKNLEADIQMWIEKVSGVTFDQEFGPMLQNGVVLCKLANAVSPGRVKKINESGGLFKFQENITNFLRFCRDSGVPEPSLFTTEALAQQKDMNQVLTCLNVFKNMVESGKIGGGGGGAKGGKSKFKPSSPSKGPQKKEKPKSKWEIKPGGSGVSLMNMGSSAVMEKTTHSDAREQIKRKQLDGKGVGTDASKWNEGSKNMEKTTYTDAREQIIRGDLDGSGTKGEVSALNQGSSGMEKTEYTDAREQIKRGEL